MAVDHALRVSREDDLAWHKRQWNNESNINKMKHISIKDFLTNSEVTAALRLYLVAEPGTFARKCAEQIITPVLPRINEKLGQQNDARFLAYMVEHVFIETRVKEKVEKEETKHERNGSDI